MQMASKMQTAEPKTSRTRINDTGLNELKREVLLWLLVWNTVDVALMFYFLDI